jgi:hypothetical protein
MTGIKRFLLWKRRPSFINFITAIMVILLLTRINTLYSGLDELDRHWDEGNWICGSYFYYLLFIKKDVQHEDWFKHISYDQPPIGKYFMGLGLDVIGNKQMKDNKCLVEWHKLDARYCLKNIVERIEENYSKQEWESYTFCQRLYGKIRFMDIPKRGGFPEDEYFSPGRKTGFFFTILTSILLLMICAKFLNSLFTGTLAVLIYLTNNVTVPGIQYAVADSICTTFTLLSLITLLFLFNTLKEYSDAPPDKKQARKNTLHKRIIPLTLLEGLFLSLAVGTKFLTTYMPVTVAAAFTLNTLIQIKSQRKKEALLNIVILATITTTALTLFILGNPFLYPHPMENTMKMLEYRLNMMDVQSSIFRTPMNSPSNRINVVYEKGILLKYRFNPVERLGYIIILLTGMLFLIKKTSSELSARFLGPHAIIILWTATAFIVNGSIVHMEWDWYYIPFALCTSIILGLGVETIIKKMLERY